MSAGVPPYTQKEVQVWMDLAVTEGPQVFEWRAKDRTGWLFWVEVSMRMANLDGTDRLLAVVRDISDRKQAESALKTKEAQYRSIVENAPMGIFQREIEGRYLYANDTLARQFECANLSEFFTRYGLIERRWAHPELHDAFKAQLLRDGHVHGFEVESRLVTGKTKWFSLYAYLDPSRTSFNGFDLDITEKKSWPKSPWPKVRSDSTPLSSACP
jgi:PAS domain-containing protein